MESHGEYSEPKVSKFLDFDKLSLKNVFRNISIKDFSSLFYLTVVSSDEFHKL